VDKLPIYYPLVLGKRLAAKRLVGKNVSEMTYFCVEWVVKTSLKSNLNGLVIIILLSNTNLE